MIQGCFSTVVKGGTQGELAPGPPKTLFYVRNFKMWVWVLFCGNWRCSVNDSFQNCPAALMRQWQFLSSLWGVLFHFSLDDFQSGWLSCSLADPERLASLSPLIGIFCKTRPVTWSLGPCYLGPRKTQATTFGGISRCLQRPEEVVGNLSGAVFFKVPFLWFPLLGLPAGAVGDSESEWNGRFCVDAFVCCNFLYILNLTVTVQFISVVKHH